LPAPPLNIEIFSFIVKLQSWGIRHESQINIANRKAMNLPPE